MSGGPNGFAAGDADRTAIAQLHADAADAVALRAENQRLRAALEEIASDLGAAEHRAQILAVRRMALAAMEASNV